MAQLTILKYPDPRLRNKCLPVSPDQNIDKLIADMSETLYLGKGVGLAAIQVGVPLRVIAVDICERFEDGLTLKILINPTLALAQGEMICPEGCLSLPGKHSEITRPRNVVVNYLDQARRPQMLRAEGLLASVLQHEIDHLDGKLFIDHISRLKRRILMDT